MENNYNEGVSLLQIFKVMIKNWKRLLIVGGIICVAGTIAIETAYNNYFSTYETVFSYENNLNFDDIYSFSANGLISKDNLQRIALSNDKNIKLDIDSLLEENAISLSKSTEIIDNTKTTDTYTISFNYSSFKNYDIKDFAKSIIYTPEYDFKYNFKDYINSNCKSMTISENVSLKINNIVDYCNLLKSTMKNFNTKFNINTTIIDQNKLLAFGTENNVSNLLSKYNSFVNDEYAKLSDTNVDNLLVQRTEYVNQYSKNVKVIANEIEYRDELISKNTGSQTIDTSKYDGIISNAVLDNVEIKDNIDLIDEELNNYKTIDNSDFINNLNVIIDGIGEITNNFLSDVDNCSICKVNVENTSVIVIKGSIAWYLAIIITLIIGLVIGLFVNLIVDRKYLK